MPDSLTQQTIYYVIAELVLEVSCPNDIDIDEILPTFKPFKENNIPEKKTSCLIYLYLNEVARYKQLGKLRTNLSIVWGDDFRFYETDQHYITTIHTEPNVDAWSMISLKDFSKSKIYISSEELKSTNILSWLLMVAFAQTSILHQTILIHASTIDCQEQGYAFLGKSGTGKSTHSRLWLEHIQHTSLLNDDNPAIRVHEDGNVYIYGTPWSGKTSCYINKRIPLKALVRLSQAPYNKFKWIKGVEAFINFLPSCSSIRWNKKLFTQMNDTAQAVLEKVPIAHLSCLPNAEAAHICYTESKK